MTQRAIELLLSISHHLYTELENCKIFCLSRNITLEKHLLVSNESNNFDVFNSTHTASHNRLNILK